MCPVVSDMSPFGDHMFLVGNSVCLLWESNVSVFATARSLISSATAITHCESPSGIRKIAVTRLCLSRTFLRHRHGLQRGWMHSCRFLRLRLFQLLRLRRFQVHRVHRLQTRRLFEMCTCRRRFARICTQPIARRRNSGLTTTSRG